MPLLNKLPSGFEWCHIGIGNAPVLIALKHLVRECDIRTVMDRPEILALREQLEGEENHVPPKVTMNPPHLLENLGEGGETRPSATETNRLPASACANQERKSAKKQEKSRKQRASPVSHRVPSACFSLDFAFSLSFITTSLFLDPRPVQNTGITPESKPCTCGNRTRDLPLPEAGNQKVTSWGVELGSPARQPAVPPIMPSRHEYSGDFRAYIFIVRVLSSLLSLSLPPIPTSKDKKVPGHKCPGINARAGLGHVLGFSGPALEN